MGRLTDNDKHFGPITYGKSSWNAFRVVLDSNGGERDDDDPVDVKTSLTVYVFGWVFRIFLGKLIKPVTYKVKATTWDQATIDRMGRDWYKYSFSKVYGFSISEGYLQIFYGLDNDNNHYTYVDNEGFLTYGLHEKDKTYTKVESKRKSWFLPWTQLRTVSYTLYDSNGNIYYQIKDNKGLKGISYYKIRDTCPSRKFVLKDYDNEEIIATTFMEETVYKLGEGKFKWVSWFSKPLHFRKLDISFDKETGTEKGSWKGGTIGTSIDAKYCKTHEDAIKLYCAEQHRGKSGKYKMEFIRELI